MSRDFAQMPLSKLGTEEVKTNKTVTPKHRDTNSTAKDNNKTMDGKRKSSLEFFAIAKLQN